ncbi:MAG: hypothetical protein OJJ21_02475 [Ferrovibrio sp.]|uniref:hypothetical protein n=1 Tax=Ferrovibrio sp. TaxID=1917215 RepID=UPI00262351EA|nr:hypothetical protein [Ferrovibrio sp.]MCW0232444.1 hypothetical protein [Ferrovibrio sp.]
MAEAGNPRHPAIGPGTLRSRCRSASGNLGCCDMKILAWIIGIVFVTGLLVWLGIFKAIF